MCRFLYCRQIHTRAHAHKMEVVEVASEAPVTQVQAKTEHSFPTALMPGASRSQATVTTSSPSSRLI